MKLLALLGAVAVAAVGVTTARGEEANTLIATVGPGFTIGLTDAGGRPVTRVAAGTYTIVVHDLSDIHNFVLANKPDGLRVRIDSGVEFVGDRSFTVDLLAGEYGYACSPHWQTMNGSLSVFRETTTPPPPGRIAITAVRLPVTLLPRAGRSFSVRAVTLTLSDGGRVRPTTLTASASIAGKRVAPSGPLTWRLPRTSTGASLLVAIRASYGEARATRTVRLRIR